jgi:Flp pilus assembly pilin Flp
MMAAAKRLWDDTSGQGLAEYSLLLGMVIIGVIVLLQGIGLSVQKIFTATNSDLETAAAAAS